MLILLKQTSDLSAKLTGVENQVYAEAMYCIVECKFCKFKFSACISRTVL